MQADISQPCVNLLASLSAGFLTGIGLYPWERACYLKNIEPIALQTSLWSAKYWNRPFEGVVNSTYHRAWSYGVYFYIRGCFNQFLDEKHENNTYEAKLITGLCTGSITGILTNITNSIKYYTLSHNPKGSMTENAQLMWRSGKFRPFYNGAFTNTTRDAVFGSIYESLNFFFDDQVISSLPEDMLAKQQYMKEGCYVLSRFCSASVAITFSSPFNYIKNMQYKTSPSETQPSMKEAVSNLLKDISMSHHNNGFFNQKSVKMRALWNILMIGPGILRTSISITASQIIYDKVVKYLNREGSAIEPPNVNSP